LFSTKFNIKSIQVQGNQTLDTPFVEGKLDYLLGQNIFLVRSSDLSTDVQRISSYVFSAHVEKKLPDTLLITIEERSPRLLWVNLAGIYLLVEEGVVLEVRKDFQNLELSSDDIDLLKGYGQITEPDPLEEEDPTVEPEEEVPAGGSTTQADGQDEAEEVDPTEKLAQIEQARQEVVARVDNFWKTQLQEFSELDSTYSVVYSYEVFDYAILDRFDKQLMTTTEAGISISDLPDTVDQYIWESDFRFVIYLKNLSKIVFSTRRDFAQQVNDLKILLADFRNKGISFSYIDLSSESILYEIDK
jgi:hypothetical protein